MCVSCVYVKPYNHRLLVARYTCVVSNLNYSQRFITNQQRFILPSKIFADRTIII